MSLSASQIERVLSEITPSVTGGALHKIDQPQPWSVVFEIHQGGSRYFLCFSASRRHSRLHLLTQKYSNPPSPPLFTQLLRARLRWKRIVSLRRLQEDRIVQMTCDWKEGAAGGALSLIAELMGPASNLFLIDPAGVLLGALFPLSAGRGLQIGRTYQPPPLHPTGSFKETAIPLVEDLPFPFSRSVEQYYRELEEKEEAEERKKNILAAIDERIRHCGKKLKQLTIGLSEAGKGDEYRRQGELLKSRLHEIKPGMKEFPIGDPTRPEAPETILLLDPAFSPSENLERFFKRYKKAQSAQKTLQAQLTKTGEELERLENDRRRFLDGGAPERIALLSLRPAAQKAKKEKKSGPPSFLSEDGLVLIVGRNDRENEEITFKIARGNDLWFHARGFPGSHLIVRMERRREIPYQTLLDAATLALHFSGARKTGKGDVLYTYQKYLQRPKGGRPGAVISSQDKNIYIELEPSRLERLFNHKI